MEKLPNTINNAACSRKVFSIICAGCGTLFTWLFGEWDMMFKILASFMVLDYITGVIVAYINKDVDSKIGFRGILKKSLILILLIVGVMLDRLIGSEWTFRTAVCYFFIGNEGWSIIENIGKTGMNIPNKLKNALSQLKNEEKIDKENEE